MLRLVLAALFLAAFAARPAVAATAAEAKTFIEAAEKEIEELYIHAGHAAWIKATYIIYDSERIAAEANRKLDARIAALAKESTKFDGVELPADVKRKIHLLKLMVAAPAPPDAAEQKEKSELEVSLTSTYGKGKFCPKKGECWTLNDMEDVLRESRDPEKLLQVWKGWRTVSPPMKKKYARFVTLANKGARDLGFPDAGAMWRSGYDMPPDDFVKELDRIWKQVEPLYASLHTHVRHKLTEKYGKKVVGTDGMIPAHLLGNMWSQSWENVYDLVAPPSSDPGYDLTELLKDEKYDAKKMVRSGENFFVSLGLPKLPETFWERSMFVKPRDREVVCHASAWDVESSDDLRIKMCIKINDEDFETIHHELGHNYYQRAYGKQPFLFKGSANDGFHEALGDTIALSVTPEYLKQVKLLDKVPGAEGDLGLLMRKALEKVAFLPFGLLVDQWRWKVFSGEVSPKDYNKAWWELREKYQKVKAPVARGRKAFDPGAKYHVPANVPYTRYFLAAVLQFQLYRSLCEDTGHAGPLHRCSYYGDKNAGKKLNDMMAMGLSRPWPDALEALTGSREMDATAIVDYFKPLKDWLDAENAKRSAKAGGTKNRGS